MILITYGTRPEYIKIKPLILEMENQKIPFKVLFTGQHETLIDGYYDMKITLSDYNNQNRLDNLIANLTTLDDEIFEGIKAVLVQGDTTSVVGMALTSMHRKIPVIHLEAGLRTHNTENPYPEENNRRIVSTIAKVHLCPTKLAETNLLNENYTDNIFVVGNTVLDNLLPYKEGCEETNKVLVTLHRRENHEIIHEWFESINRLAKETNFEFILPIHPNPNVLAKKDLLTHVNIVDPLTHDELLKILVKSRMVITDSGGLQEECSFFNKTCLVCRKHTERPEALGFTSHLVKSPRMLHDEFYRRLSIVNPIQNCPYGDGRSSEKICKILKDLNFV